MLSVYYNLASPIKKKILYKCLICESGYNYRGEGYLHNSKRTPGAYFRQQLLILFIWIF